MELARNACALADARLDGHVEFPMQLPDAQLVGRPEQCQNTCRAEGAEPIRLVVRRTTENSRVSPCSFHTPLLLLAITGSGRCQDAGSSTAPRGR